MSIHYPERQEPGRTQAQLLGLPPSGGVYFVPHVGLISHCRGLLRAAGRDPKLVRFYTVDQGHILAGLDPAVAVEVDHAITDRRVRPGGPTARLIAWIAERKARAGG